MAHDGFKRGGFGRQGGTFACGCCLRMTRRTSQGNSDLCPQCDEWTMQENGLCDALNPIEKAATEKFILNLKRKALSLGGNAERLEL